ncbi:MAG: MFS transporter [Deltaproteobacteria bacterium]|nr:MFS transporter [Deltaproteobacteria bacterium]
MLSALLKPYLALDRRVYALAVARAINVMGFSVAMPFMAIYLVEQRGQPASVYGAIFFAAGIIAALSQAEAGDAADRLGRRRVMVRALALRAVNMVALGAAVYWHGPLWLLAGLILMNGLLRARMEPAAAAAISDLTTPEDRIAAYGLLRMGVNVGWALGPALGGIFVGTSYALAFAVSAPLLLVAAYAAGRVEDAPRAVQSAAKDSLSVASLRQTVRDYPAFAVFVCIVFFASLFTTQMFATMSVYARVTLGLDTGHIGLLYTVNGLLVVALQLPAVALIRRFGSRVTLLGGPLVFALGYLGYGYVHTFAGMASCVALLTLGEVLFAPAQNDMAADLGDPKRLGRAFGLFGFMSSLGVSFGPLLGGALFDAFHTAPRVLWAIIAGGMASVALLFGVFLRRAPLKSRP